MLDRLMAFDSATQGSAQLLYKAYLRVLKINNFREGLATGGKEEAAILKQFQYIRMLQTNEGLTVLDGEDDFTTYNYTFSGISDVLKEFGQQISGATGIPLVRLFGQSPSGFNTGDADLRNYYDHILKLQENQLRPHLDKLLSVMAMSLLGKSLPEDLEFKFNPLWQMSEVEKSQIASQDSATMEGAYNGGLLTRKTALKELRQTSRITGRFTNITDEDIENAEDEPPPAPGGGLPSESELPLEEESEESLPEDANERMGGASPENLGKELSTGDRVSFRDMIKDFFTKRKKTFDEWKESDHPRGQPDNPGQFVEGGGSKKAPVQQESLKKTKEKAEDKRNMLQSTMVDGKRVGSDGKELPAHIVKAKIPPAWTDVIYSPNPKAEMLVKAKDAKGRTQYIYSEEHWEKVDRAKFARIAELNKKFDSIYQQNQRNIKGKKRGNRPEEGIVLSLIMQTGIRPGSDEDMLAEKKAYGATTLEGKHVHQNEDGTLTLDFIGKKGVQNKIVVKDDFLVGILSERAKKVGPDGKIFKIDNLQLLKYVASLDGGKFKPKDFRTLIGTKHAMEEIQKTERPADEKSYKKEVIRIAKMVAEKLGNTPAVALKSYISPVVWQEFRPA
jgi:DNA topoisomerase IB